MEQRKKIPLFKQAVIAKMIRDANPEIWKMLKVEDSNQTYVANKIRELSSGEIEAAVAIGWAGNQSEDLFWDKMLDRVIRNAFRENNEPEPDVQSLIEDLTNHGFLKKTIDDQDWNGTDLLWILKRAARRSGLFPKLPPPIPECLSAFLAYKDSLLIVSTAWFAIRYLKPVHCALDKNQKIIAAIGRDDLPRTWAFISSDDLEPIIANEKYTLSSLTPEEPFINTGPTEFLYIGLPAFDDLKLLHD